MTAPDPVDFHSAPVPRTAISAKASIGLYTSVNPYAYAGE